MLYCVCRHKERENFPSCILCGVPYLFMRAERLLTAHTLNNFFLRYLPREQRGRYRFVKDNHSLSEWIKSLQLWTKINSCNTIEATGNRNKSKTGGLMKDIDSLAHTKWRCQYHIVFAPKYRRQIIYGKYKAAIGKILRRICERCEGVEIIEANACEDHIHMLVTIPPKLSVSRFMGILKGKSSLMIFDQFANLKYKYGNRHFWCRGYYVDTVGRNKEAIKKYIANQLQEDKLYEQLSMKEYIDPFTGESVQKSK